MYELRRGLCAEHAAHENAGQRRPLCSTHGMPCLAWQRLAIETRIRKTLLRPATSFMARVPGGSPIVWQGGIKQALAREVREAGNAARLAADARVGQRGVLLLAGREGGLQRGFQNLRWHAACAGPSCRRSDRADCKAGSTDPRRMCGLQRGLQHLRRHAACAGPSCRRSDRAVCVAGFPNPQRRQAACCMRRRIAQALGGALGGELGGALGGARAGQGQVQLHGHEPAAGGGGGQQCGRRGLLQRTRVHQQLPAPERPHPGRARRAAARPAGLTARAALGQHRDRRACGGGPALAAMAITMALLWTAIACRHTVCSAGGWGTHGRAARPARLPIHASASPAPLRPEP